MFLFAYLFKLNNTFNSKYYYPLHLSLKGQARGLGTWVSGENTCCVSMRALSVGPSAHGKCSIWPCMCSYPSAKWTETSSSSLVGADHQPQSGFSETDSVSKEWRGEKASRIFDIVLWHLCTDKGTCICTYAHSHAQAWRHTSVTPTPRRQR